MLAAMRLVFLARAVGVLAAVGLVLVAWAALRAGLADEDGATTLAVDALATAAFVALLALGGALLSAQPPAARLGLRRGRFGPGALALGGLGLLGLSHAIEGALALAGAPASATLARFADALAAAGPAELALALAVFALASAGAEELLFRGLLQRGLEPLLGAAAAIALAAAAFGAAHGDLVHAAAALPLGAYLGVLAWLDGSIRAALAAHALNNAVAVLEAGLGLHLPGGAAALASIGVGLALAAGGLWGARARAGPAARPGDGGA
jgi:membrane protease YdiL (CAAX protease family)